MTTDMRPKDQSITTTTGIDWGAAITAAVELGKDGVEVLERLHAIQKDERAANARAAFYEAMAELHGRLGSIPKNRTANFKTRSGGAVSYRYADLDQIATALRKHTRELGLAWKWDTDSEDGRMSVTCIVVHRDGHYESSTWRASIEQGNPMTSAPQKEKIATTFAQRVTLIQAFGLTDTEDDVDGEMPGDPTHVAPGRSEPTETISEAQEMTLVALLDELGGDTRERFLAAYGIEHVGALPVALFGKAKKQLGVRVEQKREAEGA